MTHPENENYTYSVMIHPEWEGTHTHDQYMNHTPTCPCRSDIDDDSVVAFNRVVAESMLEAASRLENNVDEVIAEWKEGGWDTEVEQMPTDVVMAFVFTNRHALVRVSVEAIQRFGMWEAVPFIEQYFAMFHLFQRTCETDHLELLTKGGTA